MGGIAQRFKQNRNLARTSHFAEIHSLRVTTITALSPAGGLASPRFPVSL